MEGLGDALGGLGTPWVDVWGSLGDALGGLGDTLEDLLGGPWEKPWENLLEEPSESMSPPQCSKVNFLLDRRGRFVAPYSVSERKLG